MGSIKLLIDFTCLLIKFLEQAKKRAEFSELVTQ